MFRIALTTYLLLAVAAGPTTCCCASTAAFHAVAQVFTSSSTSSSMPAHCPMHAALNRAVAARSTVAEVAHQPAEQSQKHQSRNSSHRNCPCRDGRPVLVLASAPDNLSLNVDAAVAALYLSNDSASFLTFDSRAALQSVGEMKAPAQTGKDILRAYQHYLC